MKKGIRQLEVSWTQEKKQQLRLAQTQPHMHRKLHMAKVVCIIYNKLVLLGGKKKFCGVHWKGIGSPILQMYKQRLSMGLEPEVM